MILDKYLRSEVFPTPFCQGCGHGILMQAILRAVDESASDGIDIDKMAFVSGIGCAAWIPSPHFAADTLHTTHGRPIAFATGIKLVNPSLKVVVVSGDGDLSAIGGNHLIHSARRNLELTVICANNSIYGMTGGQVAPTTPCGIKTATTQQGSTEPPFDLCRLVWGAGATYIARSTVYHIRELIKYLKNAFLHQGFSFIDVISPCYTHFGRRNPQRAGATPSEMVLNLKNIAIHAKSPQELFTFPSVGTLSPPSGRTCNQKDRILIGEFTTI
ncbi:MAG: thiamine pyrophosphate-dependent enzyme [Planctomycetota bacterium]|nr:thiamine pyrophosphate-dependent enzyme [Planctomycetota bacterium]MDI6786880.1 thiamine pyrophosphate-dependent enzyme [Planctomycetota bacterium]